MRIALTLLAFLVSLLLWLIIPSDEQLLSTKKKKMNGVSLVSPREPIMPTHMSKLKEINADWVAVIPYAFAQSGQPNITFDHERQWWGERTDGTCSLIKMARENGLNVMLKPHVWVRGERWAGDFTLDNEDKWIIWESDFKNYILHQAKIADSLGVELFCIGTEYRVPARERPDFWKSLIKEVRKEYSGKITYASNWDNYQNISWWDEVDYIGIDAYFPLVEGVQPTIKEIEKGWKPVSRELAEFSKKWDKQILFTEYGFQSIDGAAGKHWEVNKETEKVNDKIQADAYEATFKVMMDQDWYAGGFFWKWYFHQRESNRYLTDWTPQNKLAEQVITKWYGAHITQLPLPE